MRSLRALAFIMLFALFAATPHIGTWVATASASSGPMTSGQEAVNAPANDNDDQDELCNSGNPRKQKKCHYNQTNGDNDNDTSNDFPPAVSIGVSNADPNEDDTFTVTLHATGHEIDQVWWWVPDVFDDNGNENDDFDGEARFFNCDGIDDCTHSSDLTPRNAGTYTIHAKARDRQGRESGEVATEVRVHDD
ncbi:MAG TPA: hypothetical protein VFH48_07645 [Chloroflexota bacterium]|nr:hypothetical protein [Chloroflexota bacterium]